MERIMKKILLLLIVGSSLSTEGMSALPIKSQSMDDLSEMTRVLDNGFTNEEYNACHNILNESRKLLREGPCWEAYILSKKAICGLGESKYSKIFTKFVDERIEAFCLLENIDKAEIVFEKSFAKIRRYAILHFFDAPTVRLLSWIKKETNEEKIIKFQKEVIFWFLLHKVRYEEDPTQTEIDALRSNLKK
jgi:hypothetical protein